MLLRNTSSSGEADQDIYLNMTSSASHSPDNNNLDAVTTYAPEQSSTTSIYHTGHGMSTSPGMNDDVWGDDDDDTPFHQPAELTSGSEQPLHRRTQPESGSGFVSVSDIPRLKQEHTTAGYRDGVTIAKAASVQAGFDEGYGLGATIGAHAGRLLGLLQGLVGALSSNYGSGGQNGEEEAAESKRLQALLETATKELNVLSIFGEEYFARDGIWKYQVSKVPPKKDEGKNGAVAEKTVAASTREASNKEQVQQPPQGITATGSKDEGEKEEEEEEETVVFADIAASHPLLKKWGGILQQEAERYGLVWDVLLPEEDHHHHEDIMEDAGQPASAEKEKDKGGKKLAPVIQNKGALAW